MDLCVECRETTHCWNYLELYNVCKYGHSQTNRLLRSDPLFLKLVCVPVNVKLLARVCDSRGIDNFDVSFLSILRDTVHTRDRLNSDDVCDSAVLHLGLHQRRLQIAI